MAAKIGTPKLLEQSVMKRVKADLFSLPWRSADDFLKHAAVIETQILPYGQQVCQSIAPVLRACSDVQALLHKLALKNTENNPLLAFLKDAQMELQRLVPVNFAELYSFARMKELSRYLKALALRAERGSLNLSAARKKMESVAFYTQKLQQIISSAQNDVIPGDTLKSASAKNRTRGCNPLFTTKDSSTKAAEEHYETIPAAGIGELARLNFAAPGLSEEKRHKIEELFWMIEEYKVSLFAQELKTPYPVSPKKLDQLIREIENTI